MATTLTINGTDYDQTGRRSQNYLIDGWGWDVDVGFWLEFHEHTSGPQPKITGPVPVALKVGTTPLFAGDLVSAVPAIDSEGRRTWGYRCLGLEYRANWIPVTAADGSGLIRFNVDPTQNPDYYVPSMAGQTVGQILTYVFNQHSSPLAAAGISTDATTTSGLGALTLVPQDEVQVAGERLWTALGSFLRRYARNIRLVITAAGPVRVIDVTTGTPHTLTMGSDPVEPVLFSRNWTSSATKVTVRGGGMIEPGYVSVLKGTLSPAWTGAQQSAWSYSQFTNPTGPITDKGTVTAVTAANQITVQSSDASRTWAANYWNGISAWAYLTKTTGTGLTYTESRPVTACTALSAGGTATLTLGYNLQNSASTSYDSYQLIGTNVPLSSGGLYDVWRLYNVNDPGLLVADHLVPTFPQPVPFLGYDGRSAALTTAPMAEVIGATIGASVGFVVLPESGQILFTRPVVEVGNATSDLNAGHYTAPSDVYALLAYSRGALTTSYPASGYGGTAYSQSGLSRTQTVDVYDWRYGGNSAPMNNLAQMLQVAVCNTLTEGTVTYRGNYAALQDPTGGHLLNVAAVGYTTGDENINIPVRRFSVQFLAEGGGLNYTTQLFCSTRQEPRTAESQYCHLSVLGSGSQWGGASVAKAPPPKMGGVLDPGAALAAGFGGAGASAAAAMGSAGGAMASAMAGASARLAAGFGAGGDAGDPPDFLGDPADPFARSRRRREPIKGDPGILGNVPGNRPDFRNLIRRVLPSGGINAGLPEVDNVPRDGSLPAAVDRPRLEAPSPTSEAARAGWPEPRVVPKGPPKPAPRPSPAPPREALPQIGPRRDTDPGGPSLEGLREGIGRMAGDLVNPDADAGGGLSPFAPAEID